MEVSLEPVSRLEVLFLQDNYVDLTAADDSDLIRRANPVRDSWLDNSILAEHGFSALVTTEQGGRRRRLLFDFGFSPGGAARNAAALEEDLSAVEVLVLSHGHVDHFGGLAALAAAVGRRDLELVLHPEAFRAERFLARPDGSRTRLPALSREMLAGAGVRPAPTRQPRPLLGGTALFLGEVPRTTAFETGSPALRFEREGRVHPDGLEDDSALVVHVAGRGLVVLSGCAHAGIVNTVTHARQVTGVERVHAVMGGLHLTGAPLETVVEPTAAALAALAPEHLIPAHCTGRQAAQLLERRMPDRFRLSMSGTRFTFH